MARLAFRKVHYSSVDGGSLYVKDVFRREELLSDQEGQELAEQLRTRAEQAETDLDRARVLREGGHIDAILRSPKVAQDIEAMICWMDDKPLQARSMYTLKHTTKSVRAKVTDMQYRLDINTLHRDENVEQLGLNDIGRVEITTARPIAFDAYTRNRQTGEEITVNYEDAKDGKFTFKTKDGEATIDVRVMM